jgi:hypothetical protein
MTAVGPGTAYITATCSLPSCNKNLPSQYSFNVAVAGVPGASSATVYAASTHSLSLVPIPTSTNVAGTAITLPQLPNSIISDPAGKTVYLGSSAGLMAVNVAAGTVNTYPVNGTIEGISADGNYLVLSDTVANSLNYFSASTLSVAYTQSAQVTTSSAFTPDAKLNEWINGNQFGAVIPASSYSNVPMLAYTGNGLDISGPGGLTYVSSSSGHEIHVFATCNQTEVLPPLAASSPTLVKAIPNGAGAFAADSPAIDIISTGTVSRGCPPVATSSIASFDLRAGAFNAQQILVSPFSSNPWILSDLPELLTFDLGTSTPSTVPLIAGATAYSGGFTLDSNLIYVGTSDGSVHRVDAINKVDVQQIGVGLKDPNGVATVPNLVAVVP